MLTDGVDAAAVEPGEEAALALGIGMVVVGRAEELGKVAVDGEVAVVEDVEVALGIRRGRIQADLAAVDVFAVGLPVVG